MPTREEWINLIKGCPRDLQVTAHSYRGIAFASFASPVVLGCDDGHDYVVKSIHDDGLKRAICSDQVMGHIAGTMAAPVPIVRIVNVPQELIAAEIRLAKIPAGPAHGSRYVPNASKTRQRIAFQNLPGNRPRFASLAAMYGLAHVDGDHQFFYEDGTNLVWSFDHGHFFHDGPQWTVDSLEASPPVDFDATIAGACAFTSDELTLAAQTLDAVVDLPIADAVASPDDSWGITFDERVALAEHFSSRSTQMRK